VAMFTPGLTEPHTL